MGGFWFIVKVYLKTNGERVMGEVTSAQRKALFALYERCATITDLARGLCEEAEGSATQQMVATDLLEQRQELKQEVKFANDVGVPGDRMNALRDAALPVEYHPDFTLPSPTAA
jgi:hypothetical protein